MSLKVPVATIGFMGSGKTSVCEAASIELGTPLYAVDPEVESRTGSSIPNIFAQKGEAFFREEEIAAFHEIVGRKPGLISTGGGIISTEAGRRAIKASGVFVVWLDVDFETAAERAAQDSTPRPLFQNVEKAQELFTMRQPWYEEVADCTVDASKEIEHVLAAFTGAIRESGLLVPADYQ